MIIFDRKVQNFQLHLLEISDLKDLRIHAQETPEFYQSKETNLSYVYDYSHLP